MYVKQPIGRDTQRMCGPCEHLKLSSRDYWSILAGVVVCLDQQQVPQFSRDLSRERLCQYLQSFVIGDA